MTPPNREQRRAAAKAGEELPEDVAETNRLRVTIGDNSVDIEVGTREIAQLELKGHTSKELADKGVLAMWLMSFEHMLRLQRKGLFDGVPEKFDDFLDDAEVVPLLGEG